MKIVCSKSELVNGVNIVSKAVPANTTMSILECILIDASKGEIKFTSNDTEIGIETVIDGTIEEKGTIAIDAKMLLEVVRKLPDADITIATDDNFSTNITCGKLKFNIMGKDGKDFTTLPTVNKKDAVIISQLTFKDIIRQTIFSIGVNESNKVMSGIHLVIKEDELKMTSLDGHRVSIRKVKLKDKYEAKEIIIPGKTLSEVSKILSGGADDDISIYIEDNYVLFEFGKSIVVSRLIEGKYFAVDKMMSYDYETKVTISKKALYDCIDRSMLFSKEGNKKPIVVNIHDNVLEILVNSPLGSMDEELEMTKQGKDITIGFNPKFVIDALKVIDDETVDLYFVNAKAPCYIKDENDNYIYFVLPVNLNNSNY